MPEIIAGTKATRMELLALKKRIELAKKGHDLLKEKRDAVIMEFFDIVENARKVRDNTLNLLREAFTALTEAKMLMGPLQLDELALTTPTNVELDIESRNVMGVSIPILQTKEITTSKRLFSLLGTSAKLDDAVEKFKTALRDIINLAEVEASLKRMAEEIEKTKRRVNALKAIVIPRIENTIRYISLHLEEREREDFSRLKFIKRKLEKSAT